MTAQGPKIGLLDIETAPIESYHWGLWEQNIGLDAIQHEWTILSVSFKWLGDKKTEFHSTGGRGESKVRDDKPLMAKIWKFLDEADIVVTQNGKSFDIKKINARLIMHGFPPYSPIKLIDTKLVAKKHFAFTSNRLQWMTEHLTKTKKSKHKKFPGFELWTECLKDNPAAWKEMAEYNRIDVVSMEELYLRMRPWIEGHPNLAAYTESTAHECPKCGSTKVNKRGRALTQTGEYHKFQCTNCGGWSRSRYTTSKPNKRKALLSN